MKIINRRQANATLRGDTTVWELRVFHRVLVPSHAKRHGVSAGVGRGHFSCISFDWIAGEASWLGFIFMAPILSLIVPVVLSPIAFIN